ncbi:MAG: SUMF1/EgtB/PvdO family nonheme iron enzyme [Polyangiaceae bacterium]|jgi:formylglycine-generating enzyme required for sulfatase activity
MVLAGAVAVIAGCNAILGTPDPELAPDGGAEASVTADGAAGVDATMQDGTTADGTTADGTADGGQATDSASQDAPGPDSPTDDDAEGDASAPLPPSCPPDGGPGVTTCGTAGDSCCGSLPVPSGTYFRAYAVLNGVATDFGEQATVSAFRLDKYEVTVGRFRQFVMASKTWVAPPPGSGIHTYLRDGGGLEETIDGSATYETGWDPSWNVDLSQIDGGGQGHWDNTLTSCGAASTWTNAPSTQESLPINCVDWYEAYAFCIWDGGFLPSEAEWEYASAGGIDYRKYPWGAADPGVQNLYAIYGCNYPDGGQVGVDAAGTCMSVANIAPVGSAPMGAAAWGQLDMGGNIFEWTLDWYDAAWILPCDDCAQLVPTPFRSTRGGNWWVYDVPMLANNRTWYTPITRDFKGGIRCARAP